MPYTLVTLAPKLQAEIAPRLFDFISVLQASEALTGTPVFTVSVFTGNDATPQNILSGAPAISGTVVSQNFSSGSSVAGNIYYIQCRVSTTQGRTYILAGYMSIEVANGG